MIKTHIQASFSSCSSSEQIYRKIIEWGAHLPPFDPKWKTENNLVLGCQSTMYLYAQLRENSVHFYACCDALISAGLAAILIETYSGEKPETILTNPPSFLEEIGIPAALTPGRANGLAGLYLKMKQEALRLLLKQPKPRAY